MQTRTLGRIGHQTSLAVFGTAALGRVDQDTADRAVRAAIDAGVTHVDIAPSYGQAEARLAPHVPELLERGMLIGCKTQVRDRAGARAELEASLGRLRMESFPLYQLHAVGDIAQLDLAMDALEAIVEAQQEGLVGHIGITGHGHQAPATHLEALRRFDFATVMFPVNAHLWGRPDYRREAQELLAVCAERNLGVLALKAIARRPWGEQRDYNTWYEPFDDAFEIDRSVRFTLSQPITGFCTPGDTRLLEPALAAANSFEPMPADEQQKLVEQRSELVSIFDGI